MRLPESCSIRMGDERCRMSPVYVVSVRSDDGEYMVALVCDDHRQALEQRLFSLQKEGKIPKGKLRFQSVKIVVTDCIIGLNEDYLDLELKRGVLSDRKLT